MNDPAWCHTRLDVLENELANLGHGHRSFAETLTEVRSTWTDSASKEVFTCFLDPYQVELEQVRGKLLSQLGNLREVVARMYDAEPVIMEIQKISDDSERNRQNVENEIETTYHRVDRSLDEITHADQFTEQSITVLESI